MVQNVRGAAADMFFSDWQSLLRILVVGSLGYFGLLFILRVSGKRVLSKMNAFDLIVTVAFGSMLATLLLSDRVTLVDGLVGLALLAGLQVAVTSFSMRSRRFKRLVTAEPRLLVFDGEVIERALRDERLTRSEVDAALREAGVPELESAYAVVLETNGSVTVLTRPPGAAAQTALHHVKGAPERPSTRREE